MGRPNISPLSAAVMIMEFIAIHGREPQCQECRPQNNLLFWKTYGRKFAVSAQSGQHWFSAVVSAARVLVQDAAIRVRTCLSEGCEQRFLDVGPHVRFCDKCRTQRRQ